MRLVRPSPAIIAARRREVAKRYRDQARRKAPGKRPITFAAIRIAELTRVFDHRFGPVLLPDTDEGVACARIMVHHLARLRNAQLRIRDWLHTCTPWLALSSREHLIQEATENLMRWRADKLAWKLRITAAERTILGLRTIGAIDQTADERKIAAKHKRRERAEHRRRQDGAQSRADYLEASLSRSKPWQAIGMSRSAWYAAGKPAKHPLDKSVPHISL